MSASRVLAVARPPTRGSGASLAPELVWTITWPSNTHPSRAQVCWLLDADGRSPARGRGGRGERSTEDDRAGDPPAPCHPPPLRARPARAHMNTY
jgi:hypothetical protein